MGSSESLDVWQELLGLNIKRQSTNLNKSCSLSWRKISSPAIINPFIYLLSKSLLSIINPHFDPCTLL